MPSIFASHGISGRSLPAHGYTSCSASRWSGDLYSRRELGKDHHGGRRLRLHTAKNTFTPKPFGHCTSGSSVSRLYQLLGRQAYALTIILAKMPWLGRMQCRWFVVVASGGSRRFQVFSGTRNIRYKGIDPRSKECGDTKSKVCVTSCSYCSKNTAIAQE